MCLSIKINPTITKITTAAAPFCFLLVVGSQWWERSIDPRLIKTVLYHWANWLLLVEAVRFELTDPFGSSVFKTGAINRTLPHFHNLWYPCSDSNRDTYGTPFERADFTNLSTRAYSLEHRVRFELTVLQFCRLLHWASLPPVHKLFGYPGGIRTPTSGFGDRRAAVDTTE